MASPKLRFKEFSLDWELKSLGSITKWYSGGTPSKDIEDYWGNGYPLISGASMHTDLLEESNVHITALGLQNGSKLAPKNSILLLVRGSMLFNRIPVGIAQKDLAFNQDVKCLIPSNGVLYQFIFQWFKSKESFIKNKVTSTGIGAGKLDTDDLQNLSFFQPTEKEQTKIASFLTTIDKKISQLNEQYQLMIQYKKGVMQKIFSQEIRFKDDNGEEFGEWIDKTLSDVGEIITGKTPSTQNPGLWEGNILFITPTDLNNRKIQMKTERTVSGKGMKILPINTIVFTCIASIGKMAITGRASITNQQINSIIVKKDNFQFIYYALLNIVDFIKSTQSTTTMPIINKTEFSKFVIKVPCVREQTKIANFLSIIDDKIENLALQLEQVRNWKKGLLQQIFM